MIDSMNSLELLNAYAREGSEEAFANLITRYSPLVYSTALACVGKDHQLAEDVAQEVFVSLARKAKRWSPKVPVNAWLYRQARYAAAKVVRAEQRRKAREERAAEISMMNADLREPLLSDILPVLVPLIADLREQERAALIGRFFEERSLREVGEVLGISEDGAQKCITRTLAKLRERLKAHGITTSAALIGEAIGRQRVLPVPDGLAYMVQESVSASLGSASVTAIFYRNPIASAALCLGLVGAITAACTQVLTEHKGVPPATALRSILPQDRNTSHVVPPKSSLENGQSDGAIEFGSSQGAAVGGGLRSYDPEGSFESKVPFLFMSDFTLTEVAEGELEAEFYESLSRALASYQAELCDIEKLQFQVIKSAEGPVIRLDASPELVKASEHLTTKLNELMPEPRYQPLVNKIAETAGRLREGHREVVVSELEHGFWIDERRFDPQGNLTGGHGTLIDPNPDFTQALERRYAHLIDFDALRNGEATISEASAKW